jgi:hypothetical protein
MTVHNKLLDVLVCPLCKGPLARVRWQGDAAAPAEASPPAPGGGAPIVALDCAKCRLRYPIVDDIPVMLVDQAQRIPG